MIKELIKQYGKDKMNTLTKYPSILTFHKIGEKGKLTNELTTPISGKILKATEKIDGTNVRIIVYENEFLIGSREFILHHSHDLYYDQAQGIVEAIKNLKVNIPVTEKLTVIYGELFGGKVSANSKYYGQDKLAFRVFDISEYGNLSILEKSQAEISKWRESETVNGIIYGQNFLTHSQIRTKFSEYDLVPSIDFELGEDFSHQAILEKLRIYIPFTKVSLSGNATKKSEGIVLRDEYRQTILKLRFEDYERTLKK